MPLLQAFRDAALEVAPERAGTLAEPCRVGHPSAEVLATAFRRAGLRDVTTGELWASADYEDFDDLFAPFTGGTSHSSTCYAALTGRPGPRRRARQHAHRRAAR
jgi:hypothetical protein